MKTIINGNNSANKILPQDRAVHEWYRFVLSFPPHLVRKYLERFRLSPAQTVLDPFCGTGTTLVECKKRGIHSIGIEANPMAYYASRVKTNWTPDPDELVAKSWRLYQKVHAALQKEGIPDIPVFSGNGGNGENLRHLSQDQNHLILKNSISPLPLHKALALIEGINARSSEHVDHQRLAFAKAVVLSSSNLHFGPEVGVRKAKEDAPVLGPWFECVKSIASDLIAFREKADIRSEVICGDAREVHLYLEPRSVDFVFTSPPYPNEKDYTRTTRLESVLLGFMTSPSELRKHKQSLLRSNTRNVYKTDSDDEEVSGQQDIQRIADEIENRRIQLGKTSGFERLYSRLTKLYFGGMTRHFRELRPILKPGAVLAYVVGDQASYLRVLIRTGELLESIAQSLGYEVIGRDLFRTRLATATKEYLREEVLLLRWRG